MSSSAIISFSSAATFSAIRRSRAYNRLSSDNDSHITVVTATTITKSVKKTTNTTTTAKARKTATKSTKPVVTSSLSYNKKVDISDKKEKHRQIEAIARTKKIELFEKLNTLIRKFEQINSLTIPTDVKILQQDLVDKRRKLQPNKKKYNNEDILRKILAFEITLQSFKQQTNTNNNNSNNNNITVEHNNSNSNNNNSYKNEYNPMQVLVNASLASYPTFHLLLLATLEEDELKEV